MKIFGMYFIKGSTAYEFQAGRIGIRLCHLWGGRWNEVLFNLRNRLTFQWWPKAEDEDDF